VGFCHRISCLAGSPVERLARADTTHKVNLGSSPVQWTAQTAYMNVYLSSTYLDLQRDRKAVAVALRKAQYQVTMMEEYAARDELVEFACQEMLLSVTPTSESSRGGMAMCRRARAIRSESP
jgi:hypothetical protein